MSEAHTTFDSVLDLCRHKPRRIILGVLAERERSLTLNDLTNAILKYSHQMSPTEASEKMSTDIHVSLYQVHLPKLAAEGFINYDRKHESVEPTEQLDQARPTLSTILDADPSLTAPMNV